MNIRTTAQVSAVLSSGLTAGFFAGWLVSAVPGLADVPDLEFVTSMQSINRAIMNPAFIVPFMAAPILLGASALVAHRDGDRRRARLNAVAGATYAIGVLGVTFARNIPLNDALEAFSINGANAQTLHRARIDFERPWNRWHTVRSLASIAAFGVAISAMLRPSAGAASDDSPTASSTSSIKSVAK